MERKVKLAPSILNANFARLADEIKAVELYSDYIHLDVMDGHFVPNITFGPLLVEAIDQITDIPIDCHLMIYNVPEWVESFAEAGADRLSFHVRSCRDVDSVIRAIRSLGMSPGLALSPEDQVFELKPYLGMVDFILVMSVYPGFGGQQMMPEMLQRIGVIKRNAAEMGMEIEVEVDGGVKIDNLDQVLEAGTDVVVVGSSIFKAEDVSLAAAEVKAMMESGNNSALY